MEISRSRIFQLDRLKSVFFRTRQEHLGEHEISATDYMASLAVEDRQRIVDFLSVTSIFKTTLNAETRIGILAVGSSLRPEALRYHPVRDLDLRILNSAPSDSEERKQVIVKLQEGIRCHLLAAGTPFEEKDHTLEVRTVKSNHGLVDWQDWYNNDPSFEVTAKNGHPLHLSISGVGNYDLDTYVRKNRESKGYFSVLLYNRPQT